MSRQKAGLRKEHELAKEIMDCTEGRVLPLRAGWSGNQSVPSPDLLIPLNGTLRAIELKTSNQKRMTVTPDDVQDIATWVDRQKEVPTIGYLAVKFSRWELYVDRLVGVTADIPSAFDRWAVDAPFDTNITANGNLTIGHPTHYDVEHTSAQKSDGDGVAMLKRLNQTSHNDLISVTDILEEVQFESESQ